MISMFHRACRLGVCAAAVFAALVSATVTGSANDSSFSPFLNDGSRPSMRSLSQETSPYSSGGGSSGGITWLASSGCVPGALRGVLADVAGEFGPVTVNSTCRSRGHNRRVGGATHSYHLSGEAVDFRVRGNVSAVRRYLAQHGGVGGLKHYGGGLFHIDTGPRRSW